MLRFYLNQGLTLVDIADEYGISIGTVRAKLGGKK